MELKAIRFCLKNRNFKHHTKGYRLGNAIGQTVLNVGNISKMNCIINVFREINLNCNVVNGKQTDKF
jgi:hypothetical protein